MNDQSALIAEIPPAIATKGLAKRYQNHFAIKDLNLNVPSGTILGILGANGAGKSSLIKLLATAEVATRGQIYVYGDRLMPDSSQIRLRQKLGYLPEQEELDQNSSVVNYLSYFASLYQIPNPQSKIRIYEVLEFMGLSHRHKHLIGNLSQGEQKRLSLARAIIHEPTILLLDNPFPSLDKTSQKKLYSLLEIFQEASFTTIITATSLIQLIPICTKISVMEYGYVTDSIDMNELKLGNLNLGDLNLNSLNLANPNLDNLNLDNLNLDRAIAKFLNIISNSNTNLSQFI